MQNTTIAAPSGRGTHPGIPLSLDFHSGEAPLATSPPTRRAAPRSTIFRTPLSYLLSGIFLSLLPIGLREQPGFAEAQTSGDDRRGGGRSDLPVRHQRDFPDP